MSISTKPPSGMRDFLPADLIRRRHVVEKVQSIYEAHGFAPLETPSIENLSTLTGKYGDEGDQLLYRLLHRRDALTRALAKEDVTQANLADQGLRYDLTVPLARVRAQYKDLPRFFKRYQIQPVWRADRPARGRFREFYQCDVDITGTKSLIAEAEVCSAVSQVLSELGFDSFTIQLNHRQLLKELIKAAGIDVEMESTALVAVDKIDKIGEEGVIKELSERSVAPEAASKLLELIAPCPTNEQTLEKLSQALDTEETISALDDLKRLLDLSESTPANLRLKLNPSLARGLGYYTGCIFEITVPDLNGSLGGGGRYDGLVGMFGKEQIPAVGFSLGLERILLIMEERKMFPPLSAGPDIMLCWMGVEEKQVLKIAHRLRSQGLKVEIYPEGKKLGKQLQYADNANIIHAAIIGDQELADDTVTLKNLKEGSQTTVSITEVGKAIKG
ncbi:histidine--tRNA ligase [Verrucomicrobia bacterium]|nr:histidine--tRNA ligase [Verrucomicrobiota bacterium]